MLKAMNSDLGPRPEQQCFSSLTSSLDACADDEDVQAVPNLTKRMPSKLGSLDERPTGLAKAESGSSCSDSDAWEELCFDTLKVGPDIQVTNSLRTAARTLPIGGSKLAVNQFGACTGKVVWRVRVDKCGIERELRETKTAQVEAACRMVRDNSHGVKIGVAQKGANLKWFAGFDKFSYGLDCRGAVWSEGKQKKTHMIDKDRQKAVCFQAGDVVTVEVDFSSMVLRFGVNDVPLPGAYYLNTFEKQSDVYLAVSLLWPGEQVTLLSEELYE